MSLDKELAFSDSSQRHKPGMSRVGLGRCLMLTRVHLGVTLTSLSHKACIYVFVHSILQSRDKFNSWPFL